MADELAGIDIFGQYPFPNQCPQEYQYFLEFCQAYFWARRVDHPLVVEIGVQWNRQKRFYKDFLGAEHIGVDIEPSTGADIIGDSTAVMTINKVKKALNGRKIDLLFIDGDHSYRACKEDFLNFKDEVSHLIAFHDLVGMWTDVQKVWQEMIADPECQKEFTFLTFYKYRKAVNPGDIMGIGVLARG